MNYIEKPFDNFNSEVKTHKDYTDVSFYETFSKIKKVELDALIPVPNDDPDYGVVTTPDRLHGYFGLYNSSLDKLLETRPVSSTYKLVPHHELFHEQAKILGQSDLPLENITVKDQLYKGGLTLVFGGQKAYHQQAKHTRNLSTTALMTKASIGLEFWNNQKDTMLNWRAKDMSLEQFGQILKQTICKKKSKSAELNLTNPVNETKLNYLLDRFEKETPDLGKTMWAGYNALTHWATHTDETIEKEIDNKLVKIRSGKSTADKPSVQRTRNDEVRTVIECDAWKELEIA